jgi:hypothetical protein
MIRALTILLLLTACAEFPQVDAAAPEKIPPRPAYLTPAELAALNADMAKPDLASLEEKGDALRASAEELRAQ